MFEVVQKTIISQFAQMVTIIVTFIIIACLRKHAGLAKLWAGMIRQWRVAVILTLIYLLALGISLTGLEANLAQTVISIVLNGCYMFCLSMLGLGFTAKITDFEPLHLRRSAKAIPGILIGAVILFALSGLINIPIGQGLIALGITGPSEPASGLEFFEKFSLFQIFFMLLTGAGIAEEVFFRLFVMSGVWCLLKRSSIAILTSAILFGLYHLTPLSNLYLAFWEYPVYQFITTFLFGAAAAWIYQNKGLDAAILGHTLGDFIGALMLKMSL